MLYYLWTVCQELLLTVTYATMMHVLLRRLYGKAAARMHDIGIGVSALICAVYSFLKLTSNFGLTSQLNHTLYALMIGCTLVFEVLLLLFGRKENSRFSAGGILTAAAGTLLSALLVFYKLPTVMMYPFNFNTMGNGFFSAYYMERLAGLVIALLLLFVWARVLSVCASHIRRFPALRLTLSAGLISWSVYFAGRFLVPWVARARWLKWPVKFNAGEHAFWGAIEGFASRNAMFFIWFGMALALVLLLLFFFENTRVTDPYENSAQRRKLRARNRRFRRASVFAAVLLVVFLVDLTAVKAYDTRVIELSEPETYTVEGDRILVPVESVSDGHLHRFEYTTENNITVRWIVVKKPNSASFGVGLDACEVCGNAGYYERGSQVVCKRCDVVMNINTIGFKGGCNPIPLKYEMADSNLVFAMEDIIAGEREFR